MIDKEAERLSADVAVRMIGYLEDARKRECGSDAAAYCAKGKIFGLAGYLDHAEECYQRALSLDPSTDEAAARLVMVLIRAGRLQCALDTALRLQRRNAKYRMPEMSTGLTIGVHSLVGLALLAGGKGDEARQAFSHSYSADRNDSIAWAYLVQMGGDDSNEKAAELLPTKGKLNPKFGKLADQLRSAGEHGVLGQSIIASALRNVSVEAHGRPVVDDGQALLADLTDSDAWSKAS